MQVQVFDVAHGFCAYVIADNGNCMLIDCGHNYETGFYPADYLANNGCTGIESFFVTNYDEDHVSGLPRLVQMAHKVPIQVLHRNRSVTPDQLRRIKRETGGTGPGVEALLGLMEVYTSDVTTGPEFANLTYQVFCNNYGSFTDTNNLSLVVFVHSPGLSMVFPGDLEKGGWQELLRNDQFRANLSRVNVFIASHHGRENGYEPRVFDFCKPEMIIISDEAMQYQTQEQSYTQHASGILWNQTERRKVLTTRNDGMLTITTREGGYYINAER